MAFSHSVKYFNTLDSTFCSTNSTEDQTVYSEYSTLGTGIKVYFDSALIQPVTGYDFIKFGGTIYEMNFDTGEINVEYPVQCPIPNVKIYRISVPEGQTSYVDWTECEGWEGPKQLLYDRMRSIDISAVENSVSASSLASISIVGNCSPYPSCQCVYFGETTTTTTTIPPINFTLTPSCEGVGINGDGKITANSFSGGNGTYQSIGIGNTAANAFNATPILLSGASTYDFTSLTNGVWYVIIRDSSGAYVIKNTTISCTNTTTTTSTTSTTSTTTAAIQCDYNGGSAVISYITTTSTTSTSTTSTTTCASLPPYSYTMYYDYDDGLPIVIGFTNANDACTATTSFTVYSYDNPLIVGSELYFDSGCGPIEISGQDYSGVQNHYRIGSDVIRLIDNGSGAFAIYDFVQTCGTTSTTSTTTIATYTYLGKASPNSATSLDACNTYSSTRGYFSLKSSLSLIEVGDIIYDTYPSVPTAGGGNWIALKSGGVGDAYSFQINNSGEVTAVGGNCNATTTSTTTLAASLVVSAKDLGITSTNYLIYASINGGFGFDIYDSSTEGFLSDTCTQIYTIVTVDVGDTVTFTTDLNCRLNGDDSSTCPVSTGANTSFTTTTITSGTNYASLTLKSDVLL